jgi:hypothetical protein
MYFQDVTLSSISSYKRERKYMKILSCNSGGSISRPRVAAVLVFATLNLAVFFIRMLSVWHYGTLFASSGGEFLMIYSIWKEMRHLPVYEWPFAFPFSLSLYNYLFYDTYAVFLKLAGARDAGIQTWGRLFTSVFAIVGATAQWKLVQNRLNLCGARSLLSLFFALGLWFCTSIVRWWALTIRPDMAAVALVMIALWIIVRRPQFGFALAGVFFYLAWSFKQSTVLAFTGVCLFLLFHVRWRDLSVLLAVFFLLTAATLFLGTPEYRFSVLAAPLLVSGFSLLHAWRIANISFIANAYWIASPVVLLLATGARRVDSSVRLLMTVFVVTIAAGFAAMGKTGASDNYLLEAFVAGSTLLQMAVFTAPGWLAGFLILVGCVQPAMQLSTISSGSHIFGTVRIATASEYADAVALRGRLALMKKPIFTTDESFALPWISTGDRAPALIVDPVFHDVTRLRCQNGGIEGMLQRGDIPTVMLSSGDTLYLKSLNPNYKEAGHSFHQGKLYSIYIVKNPTPAIDSQIR